MLIKLPAPTLFDAMPDTSTLSVFSEVCVEHLVETIDGAHHIVADCFAQAPDYTLVVEIAVFHRVPQEKAAYLRGLNLPSVEIDLQDCAGKHTTWETLAQLVLCDPLRRSWIVEAATLPAPQQMDEMTPEPTVQLDTPSLRGEWTYFIGDKTVWVRELPYRNIKVFHRPSLQTRQIVEPLCRGRGYWDKKFNCWIVFDQFKHSLLHDLEEAQGL
ncbi:hypothetical protein EZJ19_15130 [Parasulfuritortus cantonensis]|uniref:Uncharacterized protein n=1 Tax=Parasulfuritortus cantonensis TaxID=2528202 RepID=A0A4R1B6L4_9PROT|nr:hypothetical protein [Parasulfuritortus cantonensis]TCJ11605.1 hypothetical protein EZJ19_15130 [Parasulfuritortus cantonensis]